MSETWRDLAWTIGGPDAWYFQFDAKDTRALEGDPPLDRRLLPEAAARCAFLIGGRERPVRCPSIGAPTPYGLVRAGVAPDHQGTKAIVRQFEKLLGQPDVYRSPGSGC